LGDLLDAAQRAAVSETGVEVPVRRSGDALPRIAGRPETLLRMFTRLLARAAIEARAESAIGLEARVDGHRVVLEIAYPTNAPSVAGLDPF
ncbi:MAG TPA: hypothetical protein DEF51_33550, partial [Myxococcales bacterium]|nr:hypothetical protein [Myxococcales bacterium]